MTDSFLYLVAKDLADRFGRDVSKLCLVFPTRRAVLFFREMLGKVFQETVWAPKMLSIQDFIHSLTPYQFPEPLSLIFELYQIYEDPVNPEPFDRFYPWGELLLKDFDEIDKYCVNPKQLFTNLRDLKRVEAEFGLEESQLALIHEFWETVDENSPTPLQQKFLKIWETLDEVYHAYNSVLEAKGWAYDGMAYRYVQEKLLEDSLEVPFPQTVFVGFNALARAEELIIGKLLEERKGLVYWDADTSYYEGKEGPGIFIRQYHKKWKDKGSILFLHEMETKEKHIYFTGVPSQIGQSKYLGNLLRGYDWEGADLREHVIVLADENLLFPTLYALPNEIARLNITMGFPLKHTNIFSLLLSISSLVRNLQINSSGQRSFYHREVLEILKNPYIKHLFTQQSFRLQKVILGKNMVYIPEGFFLEQEMPDLLRHIFIPPNDWTEIIPYFELLFRTLLEDAQEREARIEAEYVFHFYTRFNLLRDIMHTYSLPFSPMGFANLFREVLKSVRIPFEGEPLAGLQLMGFLETRSLDFDNVYIVATNEGKLPDNNTSNSFIPYHLRKGFGLPTHEERDTIYAYHFYRLLQRASNVHLLYNTEVKSQGSPGEVSRFIRQIRYYFRTYKRIHLHERILSTDAPYFDPPEIRIAHTSAIKDKLMDKFVVGGALEGRYLSATALTTYITCPLRFYLQYVAEIREPNEIEETMEAGTFGQVFHRAMERLYRPYLPFPEITETEIGEMSAGIMKQLERVYDEFDLGWGKELKGKNHLYRDIIADLCKRILKHDKESEPYRLFMVEERNEFMTHFQVGDMEVRLNGAFDRVDELLGGREVRIVDYKTGKVEMKDYKDIEDCFQDDAYKAIFQGLFYAWLFDRRLAGRKIQVGYYTARRLRDGLLMLNGGESLTKEMLDRFGVLLRELIGRIFKGDFAQTTDETKCEFCTYRAICNR